MPKLSREELIELISKIRLGLGEDEEVEGWIMSIKQSVPHPEILNVITRNKDGLSVEGIADKLLNYQAVILKEASDK